jgi:hypothetical protein
MSPDERRRRRARPPFWVQLGLWGITERSAAWTFVWVSVALSVGGVALGFFHPLFFLGAGFVFAALWYYLCIRWTDRNGSWG